MQKNSRNIRVLVVKFILALKKVGKRWAPLERYVNIIKGSKI